MFCLLDLGFRYQSQHGSDMEQDSLRAGLLPKSRQGPGKACQRSRCFPSEEKSWPTAHLEAAEMTWV